MRILPFVALDDFAFRKGSYYGTLFCDLKTGQPIVLLATRKQEEVTQWIQNHSAIMLITRDGSLTYRKAIESVKRPILQVIDRFHLLQNLHRDMVNALQRMLPQRWEKSDQKNGETIIAEIDNAKQGIPQLNPKQEKKWQLIRNIQQDSQTGMSFRGLSKKYKIDRRTISKYIKMKSFPIQKRKPRPSMLNPYLETLYQMTRNHSTSRQIYEYIKKQGFKGGFDSVRMRITSIRKEMLKTVQEPPNIKSYHRKATMHLYWKLHQQLSDEERQDLNYTLATFPNTQELYGFVQYFREKYTPL